MDEYLSSMYKAEFDSLLPKVSPREREREKKKSRNFWENFPDVQIKTCLLASLQGTPEGLFQRLEFEISVTIVNFNITLI